MIQNIDKDPERGRRRETERRRGREGGREGGERERISRSLDVH